MQEIARRENPQKEIAFRRILLKNKLNPERIIHVIGQVHRPPGMGTNNPYVKQYMPYQYAIYYLLTEIHEKLEGLGKGGINTIAPEGIKKDFVDKIRVIRESGEEMVERIQDGATAFAFANGIKRVGIEADNPKEAYEKYEWTLNYMQKDAFMGEYYFELASKERSEGLFRELIKLKGGIIASVVGTAHLPHLEELVWKHRDQLEDAEIIVYVPEIMDV